MSEDGAGAATHASTLTQSLGLANSSPGADVVETTTTSRRLIVAWQSAVSLGLLKLNVGLKKESNFLLKVWSMKRRILFLPETPMLIVSLPKSKVGLIKESHFFQSNMPSNHNTEKPP